MIFNFSLDLALALYKLYSFFEDNKMLLSRIIQLRNVFFDLIKRSSEEILIEKEKNIYLINVFDMIWSSFSSVQVAFEKKEFENDLVTLETRTNNYIDHLVESYMKEFFLNLVDFVKKYAREDNEAELKKLNSGAENLGDVFVDNNPHTKLNEMNSQINFKLIENINAELNDSWIKRIEAVKGEIEKIFGGTNALKLVIKKFLTNFLAYYNTFFKYVKSFYPGFSSSMIPVHQIMKEIKNNMKKYNISQ